MNLEIKVLWIHALLSGEYRQGQGTLKQEADGVALHCCLGVLCEIAEQAGVVYSEPLLFGDEDSPRIQFVATENPEDRQSGVLPDAVQEWAGLDSPAGVFYLTGALNERESLANLNDDGLPFREIVRVIERHF